MTILQHGIAQTASAASGYQISRSVRLNAADTPYFTRTPSVAGNRKTFTWVGRVKRSGLSSAQILYSAGPFTNSNQHTWIGFKAGDTLNVEAGVYGVSTAIAVATAAVFRDVSAWYDIQVAIDTTQAVAADRVKIWVNGTLQTIAASPTYPTQNYDTAINNTVVHRIGNDPVGEQFAGYIADEYLVDGQALDPTYFGQTDSATGVWYPKAYTGTYGTNGFWLKFDDNSGVTATTLGKDSSGNGNNWTPNNFSVTAGVGNDSLVDSPTNYGTDTGAGGEVRGNYPTWNPLLGPTPLAATFADGNLYCSAPNGEHAHTSMATPTTGKWYWEFTMGANVLGQGVGIALTTSRARDTSSYYYGAKSTGTVGTLYTNGGAGATYGANYTTSDVIGVALNLDSQTLTFYKNGVSQGVAVSGIARSNWDAVIAGGGGVAMNAYINFGQRPFAYTAPSGFKALCTQNLPTPAIGASASTLANKYFDTTLYTGDGTANRTINNSGSMTPDLVWIKSRSSASFNHILLDSLRGLGNYLTSATTGAEGGVGALSWTNSGPTTNGFKVDAGTNGSINGSAATFVAWQWNAGNSSVSNTSGTITSTVRANQAAGISMATYTGTGANATVGHGLGVQPSLIIAKGRGNAFDWSIWHKTFTGLEYLNFSTVAKGSNATVWNSTVPTSSIFSIGTATGINASTIGYVAYCFAEVPGFSKFGSYTGNGSTDGTFVYTGFRPRYVVVKRTDSTSNWSVYDTERDTYNDGSANLLWDNLANAETALAHDIDILSNGFKLRSTDTDSNASGGTYIFMAFAETPFQYSRAR